jgi:hypothetical protein
VFFRALKISYQWNLPSDRQKGVGAAHTIFCLPFFILPPQCYGCKPVDEVTPRDGQAKPVAVNVTGVSPWKFLLGSKNSREKGKK